MEWEVTGGFLKEVARAAIRSLFNGESRETTLKVRPRDQPEGWACEHSGRLRDDSRAHVGLCGSGLSTTGRVLWTVTKAIGLCCGAELEMGWPRAQEEHEAGRVGGGPTGRQKPEPDRGRGGRGSR